MFFLFVWLGIENSVKSTSFPIAQVPDFPQISVGISNNRNRQYLVSRLAEINQLALVSLISLLNVCEKSDISLILCDVFNAYTAAHICMENHIYAGPILGLHPLKWRLPLIGHKPRINPVYGSQPLPWTTYKCYISCHLTQYCLLQTEHHLTRSWIYLESFWT